MAWRPFYYSDLSQCRPSFLRCDVTDTAGVNRPPDVRYLLGDDSLVNGVGLGMFILINRAVVFLTFRFSTNSVPRGGTASLFLLPLPPKVDG